MSFMLPSVSDKFADLYLVRHGETMRNASGKIQGRDDLPDTYLNVQGTEQAEALAKKISKKLPDLSLNIFTSPLKRSTDTAIKTLRKYDQARLVQKKELRGINHGEHDGMDYKLRNTFFEQYIERLLNRYKKNHPDNTVDPFFKWKRNPLSGAETYFSVWERSSKAIINIATENSKKDPGKPIAVFTHGAVISSLIARSEYEHAKEKPEMVPMWFETKSVSNCSLVHFRVSLDDQLSVEKRIQYIATINLGQ